MSMSIKKRLALGAGAVATIGAVGTLVAGVTFGLFSATTPTQSSTFTAGTLTLNNTVAYSCTVANGSNSTADNSVANASTVKYVVPGDSGTCSFAVAYGGNVPANVAVDVVVTSTGGTTAQAYAPGNTGTTPTAANGLYDGSAAGLQLGITDSGSVTYNSGHSWTETTLNGATPWNASANDVLVAKSTTSSTFGGSGTDTFTVAYNLPSTTGNGYQNASTTITFLVHAVQSANNGSTTGCTVGHVCTTTTPVAGGPAWS